MGDHNQRLAEPSGAVPQQGNGIFAALFVQVPRGLVGKDQLGLGQHRPGDGHPLLLAAGELVGVFFQLVVDAQQLRHLPQKRLVRLLAVQLQGHGDVVEDCVLVQKVELLEHEAHVPAAEGRHFGIGIGVEVLAVEDHLARGGLVQAAEDVQQRGFPRAAAADDGVEEAGLEVGTDAVQGVDLAGGGIVGLVNVLCR